MNTKVSYTNDSDKPQYAPDGTLVQAGQSRMVHSTQTVVDKAPVEDVIDPLVLTLRDRTEAIIPRLMNMDLHQLAAMLSMEGAGEARSEVMEAIGLRKMELEDSAKLTVDIPRIVALKVDDVEKELATLSDDDLTALEEAEAEGKDRQGVYDAIAAERDRRAG